jgi:hypothetical protein
MLHGERVVGERVKYGDCFGTVLAVLPGGVQRVLFDGGNEAELYAYPLRTDFDVLAAEFSARHAAANEIDIYVLAERAATRRERAAARAAKAAPVVETRWFMLPEEHVAALASSVISTAAPVESQVRRIWPE